MKSELQLRVLSGVVMAFLTLTLTWLGGTFFSVFSALIGLLIFYEWSTITAVKQDRANAIYGWVALLVICLFVSVFQFLWAFAALVIFTAAAWVWAKVRQQRYWLPTGIFYAGFSALSLASIRGDDTAGLIAMLFVFAIVWTTDISAYFVGRAAGGPKLAPRISPGKTWSGAIGGAFFGTLAGVGVYMLNYPFLGISIVILALSLSVFSQIGDLFESFIKRRFSVKDSGHMIPGHGGIMDRVDGLVFACFAAFLVASVLDYIFHGGALPIAGTLLNP